MGVTQSEALDAYREGGASVALGYMTPNARELRELQQTFNLHELALEDASHGHQRAKLESYEGSLFAVVRPAIYLDAEEEVRLGEMHMFLGRDYLLSIVNDQIHPQQAVYELFNRRWRPHTVTPHLRTAQPGCRLSACLQTARYDARAHHAADS